MIEQAIAENIFSHINEKTFIDKIVARQDVDRIRDIIKKPKLERADYLEILYSLGAVESKLLNYGEWDRYVILKFFVWIREFIKVAEMLFDYQEKLEKQDKEGRLKLTIRTRAILDNSQRLIEHNSKFLIDLYLNISRTTLSLGASGFLELLKNKFEMSYPQGTGLSTNVENKSGGILGFGRKKD